MHLTTTAKLLRFPDQKKVTFFLIYFINPVKVVLYNLWTKSKKNKTKEANINRLFVFCEALTELIFTPHQRVKKATVGSCKFGYFFCLFYFHGEL